MKAGEVHKFNGVEQPARDVDCILIYDEDTGVSYSTPLSSSQLMPFNSNIP